MGLIKEFKEFIVKGNAFDLAVGVIIGAAFSSVVNSLVKDVLMPPLGYLMGGIDFANKKIVLAEAMTKGQPHPVTGLELTKDMPEVAIMYGNFINALIALLIQGFAIFMVVKLINRLRRPEPAKAPATPPPTPEDVLLLREIRDALKK